MRRAKFILLDDLKKILDPIIQDDEFPYNLSERVMKDLSKVQFDMENVTTDEKEPFGILPCGYKILRSNTNRWSSTGTMSVLFVNAGGDWEEPIAFILYWDGKQVRGYVPKGGNTWDLATKAARENNDDDPNPRIVDFTEMENDIVNRINLVL